MKLNKIVFFLAFLLLSLKFYAQEGYQGRTESLNSLIDSINNFSFVSNEKLGFLGDYSVQFKFFKELVKESESQELSSNLKNSSAIIRAYSFWGLGLKKYDSLFVTLIKNLDDYDIIEYRNEDFIENFYLSDFYIQLMTPQCIDNEVLKFTPSQQKYLDSLLLYNLECKLQYKGILFKNLEPSEKLYCIVRKNLEQKDFYYNIIALARYKNQNDIPIINSYLANKKNRVQGLQAVVEFPDYKFFPLLKDFYNDLMDNPKDYSEAYSKWIYLAIIRYPNKETLSLIEKTLNSKRRRIKKIHQNQIYNAINTYPDPIYNKLIEKKQQKNKKDRIEKQQ